MEEVPRAYLLAICIGYTTCYLLPTVYYLLLTTHYLLQALGLLTGFPTERLALQGPEQPAAARYAAASDMNSDEADRDVLWSRLLSAHEAGYPLPLPKATPYPNPSPSPFLSPSPSPNPDLNLDPDPNQAGYLCGASCGAGGGGRDAAALSAAAEAMGLLTEHAYSVLQVCAT